MQAFPIGSIVRRRLDGFIGFAGWHWGVYVGNNQIVHFNGLAKKERSAFIQCDSVEAFGAGHRVVLHRRPNDLQHGIATAQKARELQSIAENGFNGTYHFLIRNCQDFCRHCIET
jgi:hypothetical protein